ncbi:hypothetical protein L9F63_022594, partial [Diploptera punctata]
MPKLTKDLDRIIFCRGPEIPGGLVFEDNLKLVMLITEIRMREDYNLKDIFVVDMKKFTFSDCQKVSLPLLKKFQVSIL